MWLLATLKPLRGHRLADLIAWGEESARVEGIIEVNGVQQVHAVELGASGRRVWLNGDRMRDLGEYFRTIRGIAFQPVDGSILSGDPSGRRRWLDRAAFTARPSHLEVVRAYHRVLSQKQAALRQSILDPDVLDVLDEQLGQLGGRLARRRAELLDELSPHAVKLYDQISNGGPSLTMQYRSCAPGEDEEQRVQALHERLLSVREGERRRRTTLVGPHRDDVVFFLGEKPARVFASRGQTRSGVLALRLAELVAARSRGQHPLFLLDDVSSELDLGRTARLVEILNELRTQVLATTTDPGQLSTLPQTLWCRVEDGIVSDKNANEDVALSKEIETVDLPDRT